MVKIKYATKKEAAAVIRISRKIMKGLDKKPHWKIQRILNGNTMTIAELAKELKFPERKTIVNVNKLMRAGVVQVSLTPWHKLMEQ